MVNIIMGALTGLYQALATYAGIIYNRLSLEHACMGICWHIIDTVC